MHGVGGGVENFYFYFYFYFLTLLDVYNVEE